MLNCFFSSDYHFFHKNIITYQNRPFVDIDNMNEMLIEKHNSIVNHRDTIYMLGDIAIGATGLEMSKILNRMNGRKILIIGNHDVPFLNDVDFTSCFKELHHLLSIKINKQYMQLCHFPIEIWDRAHYGSWMLHGHCVDMNTEILTLDGWKFRSQLTENDKIYNINRHTGLIEVDTIKIIDNIYTGTVINFNGKSVNLRVTDNHTFVGYDINNKWLEISAKNIYNTHCLKFIRSSYFNNVGINLNDELLRLYVYCTADGSLKKETNLWRIRIKKEHKKQEVKRCLTALQIDYKEYINDDYVSFNFYTPKELLEYSHKGLDKKLFNMNTNQFKIFLDAYSLSDGNKNGNGVLVYTAKKEEMDIISHLSIINGYGCTITETAGGYTNSLNYQLSIYPKTTSLVKDNKERFVKEYVNNEHFWCVTTNNGNFFMRRNGKIHVTGNCHGNKPDNINQLKIDVGVDCHNYSPISFEEVQTIMSTKEYIQYVRPHKRNNNNQS